VLNRADSRVGITHEDVAAIIGRPPDAFIPSDREIPRSVNEGTPIVASRERAEASRAFNRLADRYATGPAGAPTVTPVGAPKSSLLARRRR